MFLRISIPVFSHVFPIAFVIVTSDSSYVEESSNSSSNLRDDPLLPGAAPPPTNALVALVEQPGGGMTTDDRVRIALVSVVPGTGDVVWDEFDGAFVIATGLLMIDSAVRTELETRLTHLQPAELLLPSNTLSKATEKVLKHLTSASQNAATVRVERVAHVPAYNKAFDDLTKFYQGKTEIDLTGDEDGDVPMAEGQPEEKQVNAIGLAAGLPGGCAQPPSVNPPDEEAVLALVDFPKQVVIALAMAVKYMTRKCTRLPL